MLIITKQILVIIGLQVQSHFLTIMELILKHTLSYIIYYIQINYLLSSVEKLSKIFSHFHMPLTAMGRYFLEHIRSYFDSRRL